MRPFKWLLINQLKCSGAKQKVSGFTLIELLVGIVLAFLVITPLLGFMINVLDNERKEQAKANSEQEIKAALDYIARDLQQSVYIYDAEGIAAIRSQLPRSSATDQQNFFPVLVFWKRQYIPNGLVIKNGTTVVGNDDTFVYSLVAYYLIKDNNATWSKAARIGRFQISNGHGQTDAEINSTRDPGFQMFSLNNEGTLKVKMNQWKKKSGETYTQDILPLVDYIDQTPVDTTTSPPPPNPMPTCSSGYDLVPKYSGTGDAVATNNVRTQGFYVCVKPYPTSLAEVYIPVAEVYLRGNALARIQDTNINFNQNNNSTKIYFPQASVRVQGLGYLFTK